MRHVSSLLLGLIVPLAACASPQEPSAVDRPEVEPAATAPGNLAELLADYSARTGTSVTFDEATGKALEGMRVRSIAGGEVLQIDAQPNPTAQVDAAPEVPEFEVIKLEYADAGEVAPILNQLVESASSGGAAPSNEDVKVMSDPRTNSLLVMAPSIRMAELKELIVRLDVEQE